MAEYKFKNNTYKSKGELEIAKFLDEEGVNFIYEKPMLIPDPKGKQRIVYPDFWLSEYGIIIEFFGMNGNESYDKITKRKKEMYKKDNLEMIPIYQKTLEKKWKDYIILKINEILESKYFEFNLNYIDEE